MNVPTVKRVSKRSLRKMAIKKESAPPAPEPKKSVLQLSEELLRTDPNSPEYSILARAWVEAADREF
jgi:hypothetical protein